jgi:hypothetical protein
MVSPTSLLIRFKTTLGMARLLLGLIDLQNKRGMLSSDVGIYFKRG